MTKDLGSYKAEIFRRSNEKIKIRRKRQRLLFSLCIPLCLAAAVWGGIALSGGNTAENELLQSSVENAQLSVCTAVTVHTDNTLQSSITDPQLLGQLSAFMDTLSAEQLAFADTEWIEFPDSAENNTRYQYSLTRPVYTLTFTESDGKQMVYRLWGGILEEAVSKTQLQLTADQQQTLEMLLGLKP